jgi:hypothetical protein
MHMFLHMYSVVSYMRNIYSTVKYRSIAAGV